MNAAKYEERETLRNGATVKIRSVRADDKARFAEAFRNLEAESIYTRFFHHKKSLTDQELKAATEVDFENEVALVVTILKEESETIIGAGRYAAFDAADAQRNAEVAFAVEEDYRGQGIAGMLLRHLAAIARQKGVSHFEADVLPGNKSMLGVFSRSGLPMKQTTSDGTGHVSLSLKAE